MTKKVSAKTISKPKSVVKPEVKSESKSIEDVTFERTNKWASKYGYEGYKKIESKKSEKVLAIEKCLTTNDFGGRQGSLAKIISIMIGEEISVKKDSEVLAYDIGVMIITLNNDNGHTYGIGEPVLVFNNSYQGMTKNGKTGNSLPNNINDVRPATKKEIDEFFEAYKKM